MVRAKHASNDPRGDDPNPIEPPMVFKPRYYKTMEIQRTWLSEFKDRPIITGRDFERNFLVRYLLKMLAPMDSLGWNGLRPLPDDVYTNWGSTKSTHKQRFSLNMIKKGISFSSSEEETEIEGTNVHDMEVEENFEIPPLQIEGAYVDPNAQKQEQDVVHEEEHVHEGVHVEEEYPTHGAYPSQEGTSSQGGPPAGNQSTTSRDHSKPKAAQGIHG
ncbi:hypothetical protein Acr_00g0090140 [Actinidia rufa]|uniref:Uncharacterized protein n=1 Tax=Actinidia rufa TaxID=165716 RepID=A0A7J0DYN6_9ERIC|nr:hypothetical protein Acr_00g0090140 [Actinidia rufa]